MNSENNISGQDADIQTHLLSALDLHRQGDLDAAISLYEKMLEKNPDNADILHLLGMVRLQTGDYLSAEQSIRRAIQLEGNRPDFHANLASALAAQKKYQQAEEYLELSLGLNNEYLEACLIQGKIFLDQNKIDNAVHSYEKALTLAPDRAGLHFKLAMAYMQQGRVAQAAGSFLRGLNLRPAVTVQRRNFFKALRNQDLTHLPDCLLEAIESTAGSNGIDNDGLAHIALAILLPGEAFQSLYKLALHRDINDKEFYRPLLESKAFCRVANDALLVKLLQVAILRDIRAEILLGAVRSAILFSCTAREDLANYPNIPEFDFTCALAIQCFNNEYAYIVHPDETELVTKLIDDVTDSAQANEGTSPDFQVKLALLSMYLPLSQLAIFESLPGSHHSSWLPAIQTLIKKQVDDYREEAGYQATFNSMSGTIHAPSLPYHDQYNTFPYPRWLSMDYPNPMSLGDFTGEPCSSPTPAANDTGQAPILVAGCGTGREAIAVAAQFPDSGVLAIDFSSRSLSYAKRMATQLGFNNIDFRLSDIMNMEEMNRKFSLIICNGVLHHLSDPAQGWKILVNMLAPGGHMNIGVYSERGRHAVSRIRHFLGEQDKDVSIDLIRKTRRAIIRGALSAEESEKADICRRIIAYRDFYSLSQCRFLLFDLPEHLFSIPELQRILASHNLSFSNFCNIPPARLAQYTDMFPEDRESADLENWDKFESIYPDTFQEMYNFWCQKRAL